MSVLLECQPGDEFICQQEFHASPDGTPFSWETSRHFRVGERLRFVGQRLDPHFKDRPNGWRVVFEAKDGKRYAAIQTLFVTLDCWAGIKKRLTRPTPKPRTKRAMPGIKRNAARGA